MDIDMQAVTYSRYSSDSQREESIEAQRDAIQKYAKDKGYTVVKQYADHALSGRESDKRLSFLQMIEDAKQGLFRVILIHKQNRFARNRGEAVYYKTKLKKYGVKVIAVTEDFGDGPVAVLMESILEGLAEYQSFDLANEVMKGLMVNAKHCKHTGGKPLYGYRVNKELKYEIEEPEAKVVRLVFEKTAEGWSYAEIVNYLNNNGFRKRKGKKWGRNIIFYMLRNERYAGVYIFNQFKKRLPSGKRATWLKKDESEIVRIPGGIPAIVPEGLFYRVQEILNSRRNGPIRRSNKYLLTGFIFCGNCGGAYVGSGSKIKHYYYYSCSRRKNVMDCKGVNINARKAEEQAVSMTLDLINSIDSAELVQMINDYIAAKEIDSANTGDNTTDNTATRIARLTQKINNLLDFIEDGNANENVKARLNEYSEEKAQIENQLKITKKKKIKPATEQDIINILKTLDPVGKTDMELRTIFKRIGLKMYVFSDRKIVLFGDENVLHNVQDPLPAPTLCQILIDALME